MRRILFVDDEQRILDGLQGLLRRNRTKWDMVFACGGAAALAELKQGHFDVIVSDMRMPQMSGAVLLGEVRARYPHMVRIILSGFSELETRLNAAPVAHQFLSKPCDREMLDGVIERSCDLQGILDNEEIRRLVGRIDRLPPTPRIYARLVSVSESPDASIADMSGVILQDVGMCANLLQLVNSAFFALPRRITTVDKAVTMLGFEMVKSLVLSLEIFNVAGEFNYRPGFDLEALQRHALLTASLTRFIAPRRLYSDEAFMAAMLHDIGELVLAMLGPDVPVDNVPHAEVGAYLLGLWGLPYSIVEAVAHHHHPSRAQSKRFDLVTAVHVADVLANELEGHSDSTIDEEYLGALGIVRELEDWRAQARAHQGAQ